MQIVMLILLILCAGMLALLLLRQSNAARPAEPPKLDTRPIEDALSRQRQELNSATTQSIQGLAKVLSDNQSQFSQMQQGSLRQLSGSVNERLQLVEKRLETTETTSQQQMENMRKTINSNLLQMQSDNARKLEAIQNTVDEKLQKTLDNKMSQLAQVLTENQSQFSQMQKGSLQQFNGSVNERLQLFEQRLQTLETTNQQKMEDMRKTISTHLLQMQNDNAQKLESIQNTVDEKLQKTLEEKMSRSFQLVSQRLEEVYKGLGEMQQIATGVGDLKKVLSNVKTRGILGEIQLGAILREILSPEQYETEIPTIPGSRDHVEFAVKIPTAEDGKIIYLPIDSKFPGDSYANLQDAYTAGDAAAIQDTRKQLEIVIKRSAKDIHDKYIAPPHTTSFGILFLPFEGLYAEVVNMTGLVEELQRTYHVNIAGPSTMAAMLNALQMSFQTISIQKRSSEVWELLGAVKNEFTKFESVLDSARNRIRQLDDDLDKLVGVRTRSINRKLRNVELLDDTASQRLLGELYED